MYQSAQTFTLASLSFILSFNGISYKLFFGGETKIKMGFYIFVLNQILSGHVYVKV